jgi:peptidoglycan/LPS O-acetylase OafA/YrhL
MRYVPALDGLRAVAIVLVVAFHATGFPSGGWLGVDLFFVLSGFLITTLLLQRRHRESIATFYRRRAARLVPALLVLLLVSLAIDGSWFGVLAGLGYFSNLVIATDHSELMPASLFHLWSLAAEEQFYLVWPFVLFAALRVGRLTAFTLTAGGAVGVVVLAIGLGVFTDVNGYRLTFAPDTRGISILVGCALALIPGSGRPSLAGLEIPALALVLGLSLTLGDGISGPPIFVFALASAVLLVRCLDANAHMSRVLSVAPLVFLGRISYSLYLWHFPILIWLGVDGPGLQGLDLVAVALALAAASASYYCVERPFLRRLSPETRRRPTRRRTRRIAHNTPIQATAS